MATFDSVLRAARQLTDAEQQKLIDALWGITSAEVDVPLLPEWDAEIERRLAGIESGASKPIPWETIRAELNSRDGQQDAG